MSTPHNIECIATLTLLRSLQREGQKLGEIPLQNAAIGRQSSRAADAGDDSYIHAFLVRTTTRATNGDKDQEADHILCAESDEARDAWVTALTSLQAQPANVTRAGSASFDREREKEREREREREPSANGKTPQTAGQLRNRERSSSGAAATDASAPTTATVRAPAQRRTLSADIPSSVSLPSGLDSVATGEPGKRTTSAQGHNSELRERSNQLQPPLAAGQRATGGTSSATVNSNGKHHHHHHHHDRPVSPDNRHKIVASQVSGPMNAAPMPSGYEFKKAERTKKTKSSFWNFSRNTGPSPPSPSVAFPRMLTRARPSQ